MRQKIYPQISLIRPQTLYNFNRHGRALSMYFLKKIFTSVLQTSILVVSPMSQKQKIFTLPTSGTNHFLSYSEY